MDDNTSRESKVRFSLIDVMYGVVLAYGFNFFDQAKEFPDYFRFFFAYAVFIIDWIYVHRLYWGWEYYNIFLVLDIGILFAISRLLFTSTAKTPNYFLWLAVLFTIYVVWDIVSKVKNLPSQYDWRYCIAGDIFASVTFIVLWVMALKGILQTNAIFWSAGPVTVFVVAFFSWFKKMPAIQTKSV